MSTFWTPNKTKFKRLQKGIIKPIEFKKTSTNIYFGYFGLKALKNGRITAKQLEAARRMISKHIRKKEKLWIRNLPDIPVTAKPNEIRMGKGKGAVSYWVTRIKAGQILFELSRMSVQKAILILKSASKKLPIPTIFTSRPQ
jgi:large subunit ribosomal protein L16